MFPNTYLHYYTSRQLEHEWLNKQVPILISHKQHTHNRNYLKHRGDDNNDGDPRTWTVDDYKEKESTEMNDTLHSIT